MINPITNIIDNIYRNTTVIKKNIILHMRDSLIRSLMQKTNSYNPITVTDHNSTVAILNLLNINGHITDNYIEHHQYLNSLIYSHIKDIVMFNDFPVKALKREDFILLGERLNHSKLVCIGNEIAKSWPENISRKFSIIEPGVLAEDINTDRRDPLIVLSDNSKSAHKICSILNTKYKNIKIITAFEDYENILDQLNKYKVCLNLSSMLDSIVALAAGCVTIAQNQLNKDVIEYRSIEHVADQIESAIDSFDIKRQKDISLLTKEKYNYNIFQKKFNEIIDIHFKEAFII